VTELHCDVIVVGAGPAGVAAAVSAAEAGRSVILLDDAQRAGGQVWRRPPGRALPAAARRWLGRLERSGVQHIAGATVVDAGTTSAGAAEVATCRGGTVTEGTGSSGAVLSALVAGVVGPGQASDAAASVAGSGDVHQQLPRQEQTKIVDKVQASGSDEDRAAPVRATDAGGDRAASRAQPAGAGGNRAVHWVLAERRSGGALLVRAPALVIATGARERFLPFPGWTLPGVVGVGGVQALLAGGMPVAGRRAVVAGSGPLLLPAAAALARAGARVVEVVEQADGRAVRGFARSLWRTPARLVLAAAYRAAFAGAPYRTGSWVVRAEADVADPVAGAALAAVAALAADAPVGAGVALTSVTLTDGRHSRTVACDLLCTGYGLVPATELAQLLGCAVAASGVIVDDAQRTSVPGVWCAGEPTGVAGVDAALVEGKIAGLDAALSAGRIAGPGAARLESESANARAALPARLLRARARQHAFARAMDAAFELRPELRARVAADTVVCRCEDVRWDAVRACAGARDAKLAVRAGMGPCQARVCGPALEYLLGWTMTANSVRAPVSPALVATLIDSGAALTAAQGDG
jgi:D-hydroxyproline dehydrogenase subunit alpha